MYTLHICIYYIYVYITYMYISHICIYYIYVYIPICTYVKHIYTYIYVHIYIYLYTCIDMYVYMYKYTHAMLLHCEELDCRPLGRNSLSMTWVLTSVVPVEVRLSLLRN